MIVPSTRWELRDSYFCRIAWASRVAMKATKSLAKLGWGAFFGALS